MPALLATGLVGLCLAAPPTPPPKRGNTIVDPERKGPSYAAAVNVRFGMQLGGAREVIQPYGFGFGLNVRAHPWRVGLVDVGFLISGGHTRTGERETYEVPGEDDEIEEVERPKLLSQTDFAGGLSLQIAAGPVLIMGDFQGGMLISRLTRPVSPEGFEDVGVDGFAPMIRGGLGLGIPIARNQGIAVGASLLAPFSNVEVPVDPAATDENATKANVFDLVFLAHLGYQGWF